MRLVSLKKLGVNHEELTPVINAEHVVRLLKNSWVEDKDSTIITLVGGIEYESEWSLSRVVEALMEITK